MCYLLLDRKGLLCVDEALMYVESPTKVDIFFPIFCKKIPRICNKTSKFFFTKYTEVFYLE